MKKLIYSGLVAAIMALFTNCESLPGIVDEIRDRYVDTSRVLRVATFNIEYNNTAAGSTPWQQRKYAVEQVFSDYSFDIVGIQEPYISQLKDLDDLLPAYRYAGNTVMGSATADNQLTVGMLYKTSRLTLLDSGMFWLSETPDVLSKGWNNSQYRVCNWGKFKDVRTNNIFFYFSVHLDFDEQAWEPTLQLIADRIAQVAGGFPAVLGGDFNFSQYTETYRNLIRHGHFKDTYLDAAQLINPYQGTFTNYGTQLSANGRIDHLFLANCRNIAILKRKIITDSYAGVFPSDHAPVMAELILPTACVSSPMTRDTIHETFERAVIKGQYPTGEVVTPSGIWIFNGALVYHREPTDFRPMAPRLIGINERGTPDLLGPGFIETEFSLQGLKAVEVRFVSMPDVYDVGPDFAIEVQVSTDGGNTWQHIGTKHAARYEVSTASFSINLPTTAKVRILNQSPQAGTNLLRGNRINILDVTLVTH
jgi:Metal-dependent hydrolase